jgi:anti-sigma regulatory factor (Ser/Thr protein kinase)
MPLGLMAGMDYEERHAILQPGQGVLLHSDGLVEAHGPDREMFGFPRLRGLVSGCRGRDDLIALLLRELDAFTGDGWEQEDDITLVSVQRDEHAGAQTVAEFTLPSSLGNERTAMDLVAAAVARLGLPPARLERLKTAVAETTGNAIEHGNDCQPDVPVAIRVLSDGSTIWVRITDHGAPHAARPREEPDLEAKLEGRQTPRGWGLFLVEHMVDDAREITEPDGHTVELTMHLEEPRRDH